MGQFVYLWTEACPAQPPPIGLACRPDSRDDIPIVRNGRAVRFDPSDLDAWIKIKANKSRGPQGGYKWSP